MSDQVISGKYPRELLQDSVANVLSTKGLNEGEYDVIKTAIEAMLEERMNVEVSFMVNCLEIKLSLQTLKEYVAEVEERLEKVAHSDTNKDQSNPAEAHNSVQKKSKAQRTLSERPSGSQRLPIKNMPKIPKKRGSPEDNENPDKKTGGKRKYTRKSMSMTSLQGDIDVQKAGGLDKTLKTGRAKSKKKEIGQNGPQRGLISVSQLIQETPRRGKAVRKSAGSTVGTGRLNKTLTSTLKSANNRKGLRRSVGNRKTIEHTTSSSSLRITSDTPKSKGSRNPVKTSGAPTQRQPTEKEITEQLPKLLSGRFGGDGELIDLVKLRLIQNMQLEEKCQALGVKAEDIDASAKYAKVKLCRTVA